MAEKDDARKLKIKNLQPMGTEPRDEMFLLVYPGSVWPTCCQTNPETGEEKLVFWKGGRCLGYPDPDLPLGWAPMLDADRGNGGD